MKTVETAAGPMPVHFGWAALAEWTQNTGLTLNELNEIGEKLTVTDAIFLVYAGLRHGARKEKVDFHLTIEDVADLMDETPTLMSEAMEEFSRSMSPNAKGPSPTARKKR
jgi:hypothetical protein